MDKTAQRLSVAVDGAPRYQWPVSTARWGYRTPNGSYRPQWLARKWFSRKYDWSPMPYSIFFDGGYAIHGSYEISHLGRPASHGCIRLHPQNAAVLFALVQERMDDTQIVVTGERAGARGEQRHARARTRRNAGLRAAASTPRPTRRRTSSNPTSRASAGGIGSSSDARFRARIVQSAMTDCPAAGAIAAGLTVNTN